MDLPRPLEARTQTLAVQGSTGRDELLDHVACGTYTVDQNSATPVDQLRRGQNRSCASTSPANPGWAAPRYPSSRVYGAGHFDGQPGHGKTMSASSVTRATWRAPPRRQPGTYWEVRTTTFRVAGKSTSGSRVAITPRSC